jgi:DNA replication and repair protein RecF
MFLSSLELINFRKLKSWQLSFDQQVSVLVGPNASGKTSVVEAIFLLASGDSFRATKVEEMITLEKEIGRVIGVVQDEAESDQINEDKLEILLTRGFVQGKRTVGRLFSVNSVKKRRADFIGKLPAVVFRPEDMRLIEGSPERRRQFVDTAISIIDRSYAASLHTYEQALKRRNKLLQLIKVGEMSRSALTFWSLQLIKHGQLLQQRRQAFFDHFSLVDFPVALSVKYDSSPISEERLKEYDDRSIASGHTLIGPHKDDFVVNFSIPDHVDQVSISAYGSRGQQRMAVLWLKVGEMDYLKSKTLIQPLLLLDDILSELDEQSRSQVLSLLIKGQTIITSADERVINEIIQQYPAAQINKVV